jgi:hypothetical protein
MILKRLLAKIRSRRPTLEQSAPQPLSFEHVERTINETALDLFERYRSELLTNPPLYLLPAVWGEGTRTFTEPDAAQRDMHRVLAPVLEELTERFSQSAVDSNGTSGPEYLLKGLVLYKMAYMVQYYLNCKGHHGGEGEEGACLGTRIPS